MNYSSSLPQSQLERKFVVKGENDALQQLPALLESRR
jgi:hypothetical protein